MTVTLEQLQRLEWPSKIRDAAGVNWYNGATGKRWFKHLPGTAVSEGPEAVLARGPVEILEVATDSDDEVVCPFCGFRMSDAWELFEGGTDTDYTCDECNQRFLATADYTVTYSTRKP